ncbi:MAG: sulfite exporter TauE/SafE family protein, partial [Methanotrichaceae archaeon]|nr:sulfite exporter TauE/SafE family protein [Methanotrichaceae archaeon]
ELLKLIFGIIVLLGAFGMIFAEKIKPGEKSNDSLFFYIILGFMIGISSGVSGIGGGIILVPTMFGFMGFSILEAIGTSALVIAMNSIGGILSYALNGLDVSGLPPYSIGYINLLIFALLAGTSVLAAQLGVRFAHKLPDEKLRIILIALMIYIGLKMTGAFEWFGSFVWTN